MRASLPGLAANADEPLDYCRIVDASANGFRIEVQRPLASDTAIRLEWREELLLAEVRYCHPVAGRPGFYHAGLEVLQALRQLEHLRRLMTVLTGETATARPAATTSPSPSGT